MWVARGSFFFPFLFCTLVGMSGGHARRERGVCVMLLAVNAARLNTSWEVQSGTILELQSRRYSLGKYNLLGVHIRPLPEWRECWLKLLVGSPFVVGVWAVAAS